jgi:hypothetical protein
MHLEQFVVLAPVFFAALTLLLEVHPLVQKMNPGHL